MIGNKHTAIRLVNAEQRFADQLRNIAGCSEAVSHKLVAFYAKHKLVKLDPIDGQARVVHGALLDREVVLRAIEQI